MTLSRRTFLKRSLTVGVAAPLFVPAASLGLEGNTPPSERITMGLIGSGSHGAGWNLDRMFENPMQQVIAVCDVDQNYLESAQKKVDGFYSQKAGADYKACEAFRDFRDLVNKKQIDAVCIATPDHWHVLLSVFAMKAGKDVICEKPTLTIEEGRILSDAQKKTGRVYQTASENRSIDNYQYLANVVRNGEIGELRNMKVLLPPGNTTDRNPGDKEAEKFRSISEPPKELDYETWLGPAPVKPYIPARNHYNWRWNFDYSGGVLTDWGSHLINIAQWANNSDDTGPVEVQGTGDFPDFNDPWNTPPTFRINYRYKNGVTMEVWTEVPGIKLEGTKGWIMVRGWRQEVRTSNDRLLALKFEGDKNLGRPESTVKASDGGKGGEHLDFANCVKSRKPCYYTAECGHRNHTIAHIANISMLLGGAKLQWDPVKEQFVGDRAEEANQHFCKTRKQRDPWTFQHVDSWINVG